MLYYILYEVQTNLILGREPEKNRHQKNAQYIIERVADFGNDKEARWVLDFYSKKLLKKIIGKSRCLRSDTKELWTLLLKG
ncbi:MAG: hypothetical protein COV60_01685 [Candidatus Magasanikbacteria bacterium CG11_big_fil_rev_8_21_14_0_20_43_7]|uniref:DUF6922 domain-containing protein n=2 Tax=Candidatus Magasanikiibacteriota TaxID=1752731 RepID=A0A2M6P0E1_9BACT|nr:MAG: hypothetical protein COV60_01685 [Candidatus Magasanikbacteria bacterium CG11_big_fil_rev_8_21_14_0_20_43_7]PIR77174.1 MAG: hypothetical protein COU30_03935 [Candidatus Magasanikbacteria bacterium CG10_big_fil_rev_8_21_14_0_10_38_6]